MLKWEESNPGPAYGGIAMEGLIGATPGAEVTSIGV